MTDKEKKAARPVFPRKAGQVGVYIDIYETTTESKDAGSAHFFLMTMLDKLYEHIKDIDLSVVKGAFERQNLLEGIIFEKIEKGIILVATCESLDALKNIWDCHKKNEIAPILQTTLITDSLMKTLEAKTLTLRATIYPDEYKFCDDELLAMKASNLTLDLNNLDNDKKMLRGIRNFQEKLGNEIYKIKDEEQTFHQDLGDFILIIKRNMPANMTALKSLADFKTFLKEIKGKPNTKMVVFENYLSLLERLRGILSDIERYICHPLAEVHSRCETENQRSLKKDIKRSCCEMQGNLQNDNNLTKLQHTEWKKKIVARDHKLVLGLVSLVPLTVDGISEIDQNIDEYFSGIKPGVKI